VGGTHVSKFSAGPCYTLGQSEEREKKELFMTDDQKLDVILMPKFSFFLSLVTLACWLEIKMKYMKGIEVNRFWCV
jgi:hypothetical protein